MNSKYDHPSSALQMKIERLTVRFLNAKEPDFLNQHTRAIDDYFRKAFETSSVGPQLGIKKNPYAIIALGGYGRQEQCIHSDVDLLFLFEKRVPQNAEKLIREMIYPLWDIGLEVGYATRSLKECLRLAARDFDILTPMLDARFICGMSLLYADLIEQLRDKTLIKRSDTIIDWLVKKNEARHFQFGDSTYLLEPNLKEGQGGLRDYHTMLWISKIEFSLKHRREFMYLGLLAHEEYEFFIKALDFIWNVRNRIHHLCGRKCDQLNFENQIKLARTLKYRKTRGQEPVEKFLGELHGRMEYVKQQHLMFLHELGLDKKRKRRKTSLKKSKVNGLEVRSWGLLNFITPEAIINSPDLLIKIFEESARLKLPLSAEAKRLVREFSYLVDKNFRTDAGILKSFESILVAPAPTFNVLNEMLNTGLLQRYIPEFKKIVNRIQYDEYHLYPVDKHSLRTVQTIKRFSRMEEHPLEPLCNRLYRELRNKKLLLWGALLHDIGKGGPQKGHAPKGAATVLKLLIGKGLPPKDVDTITFLIRVHLLLIESATRRDIHDEETAISCARRIKDVTRLKMLYLLTVADSISTGPLAWSDWTATILRDFFLKVLNILEKGELATQQAVEVVEQKQREVVSLASSKKKKKELDALFKVMSPRYLLYTPVGDIAEHIKLYKNLGDSEIVWKIERSTDTIARTVTICAQDRPGLISKIAGVFTLNNIAILDVQVFTWRNQIALDIFKVNPPPDLILEDEKWNRAEENLKAALAGELDLASTVKKKISAHRSRKPKVPRKPHHIVVDNTSSSFFTIVEVYTYDFLGLLYSITDALYRCGLNIWVAKIATKVDQVVDVFYVRDLNGQKVDRPEQESEIKSAILEMLPGN
jgi:[protein-PII] uridylyltransferase